MCNVIDLSNAEIDGFFTSKPAGQCGCVVSMLRPVIKQQNEWINVQTDDTSSKRTIQDGDLYAYFALLFMSHLTNLSMTETPPIFHEMALHPPTESLCALVASTLYGLYPSLPSGQSEEWQFAWDSRHVQTHCLTSFERNALAI